MAPPEPGGNRVRWLIVDLDGVVRRWEPLTAMEAESGLPPGAVHAIAFEPSLLSAVTTGQMTDEAWRAAVSTELARRHAVDGVAVVAQWSAPCGTVDTGVRDVLRGARQRWPVALLSNATTRLAEDLRRLGLAGEFDAVFNSAELGVAKPDRQAFEAVCRSLGASPGECLFVDDSPGHVAAAEAVGLTGHVFQDAATLERFLAAYR